MTAIITVTNQKGGVGKTTTAVNLAAELARIGKKVVIIDIDPQGNATSGLGISREGLSGLYEVLFEDVLFQDVLINTTVKGLDLVPANRSLLSAEMELVSMTDREYRLKSVLGSINGHYDLAFIDTPPSLGLLTVNALTAADGILIPIQCEYYALEGLSELLRTYEKIRDSLNPFLEITGIVMTMYDERTNLSSQVFEEVKRYFQEKVFDTIIPRNVRLSEAPGFGKPVYQHDPACRGALAYQLLAEEMISRRYS